jgi:RanBP-type and C3HC4-type zinc finger-containing protein 1
MIDKSPNYPDLMEMQDSADFVPNIEPFSCRICFVDYDTGEGMILRECLHVFCFDCIRSYIMHCTDVEIKCPFMDDEYSCESFLQVIYTMEILMIFDLLNLISGKRN